MEEFIKRRSYIKTRLTRAKNKLENQETPLDRVMCEMLDEQLQELRLDLNSCADDIMTTCDDNDAEDHEEVFNEMFDKFNSMKYTLKVMLESFNDPKANIDGAVTSKGPRIHTNSDAVKLPKLELPSFAGNYVDWTAFADLFRASVHSQSLSGAQKLQYLKGALRGEALQLIQGYSISDANYLEAWNVLQRRYQNNREIVRSIINKFIRQPFLKEKNAIGLRSLLDPSTSCILALRTMGYTAAVEEDNYWISFLLMERLDEESRELWETKIGRNNMPKWSELIEFLDERRVNAYVIPKITCMLPKQEVKEAEIVHLKHVTLADPLLCKTGVIDVLLGAEVFFDILRNGRITGPKGCPVGQQSVWGFIVVGKCVSQAIPSTISIHHAEIDASMEKFWQIEEIPSKKFFSLEDQKCENHFKSTHTRAEDGRYVVRLPFREECAELGTSINLAEKRLRMMERRLGSNPDLKAQNVKFMNEYLSLGHMEQISDAEVKKASHEVYYLPHHP
ncbi:unnamed protein product, partial [Allacma fusca]